MSELELTLKILKEVSHTFGAIIGIGLILLFLIMLLLLNFFRRRIENIADEISDKSVAAFNKKIDVAFRDEYLRNNLRLELGTVSYKKKIEMFEAIYSFYFEYQKSWSFTSSTPREERNILWQKILDLRKQMFLSAIFLGPELFKYLFDALGDMLTNLQIMKLTESGMETDAERELAITKSIDMAAKWLAENLITHQDIKMYELTDDMISSLDKERKKILQDKI